MNEGQKREEKMRENQTYGLASDKKSSKGHSRFIGIIAAAAVLIAVLIGVGIYNSPANQLARQLNLGNRYLEEENYEMAAVAFEKAIAIDDRCLPAYEGQIQAYMGINDADRLMEVYENALSAAESADENAEAQDIESVVAIYLAAENVYNGDTDRIIEVLAKGAEQTEDTGIKEKLEENQKKAEEEALAKSLEAAHGYAEQGEYEKALEEYDKVPEQAYENEDYQTGLGDCLQKYVDKLMDEERLDEVKEVADRYGAKTDHVDFQDILDRVAEREKQAQGTWVDDLFAKMMAGDYEAVYAIMEAPDFIDKCSEYPHEEVYWSMDYCLTTSDGKVIGVIRSLDYDVLHVAYCVHDEHIHNEIDGLRYPNTISGDDYCYEIKDGKKTCLIGNKGIGSDGSVWEVPSEGIWEAFHV